MLYNLRTLLQMVLRKLFGQNFTRAMCYPHIDLAIDNYSRTVGDIEAR